MLRDNFQAKEKSKKSARQDPHPRRESSLSRVCFREIVSFFKVQRNKVVWAHKGLREERGVLFQNLSQNYQDSDQQNHVQLKKKLGSIYLARLYLKQELEELKMPIITYRSEKKTSQHSNVIALEQSNPNCFFEQHLNKKIAVFRLKKDSKTMVAQNNTCSWEKKINSKINLYLSIHT